jgi:hypothetical protein
MFGSLPHLSCNKRDTSWTLTFLASFTSLHIAHALVDMYSRPQRRKSFYYVIDIINYEHASMNDPELRSRALQDKAELGGLFKQSFPDHYIDIDDDSEALPNYETCMQLWIGLGDTPWSGEEDGEEESQRPSLEGAGGSDDEVMEDDGVYDFGMRW